MKAPQKNLKTKKISMLLVTALAISLITYSQSLDTSIVVAHRTQIFSKVLNENRTIYVATPSRMKAGETYPVMYLLDGEAFIEMVSGQMLYLSESYKINPSMIIVGIRNTDRVRDLTPTHNSIGPDGKPDTSKTAFGRTSGGAEDFLRFIKDELMPFIASRYPVAPYNILAGHSLGGLMAVYCMVRHPDYFNAYIAASPSVQWDNEFMLKQVAKMQDQTLSKRFFLCHANEEGSFYSNQLMLDSMIRKKMTSLSDYRYIHYGEETHNSEPVKAFYDGVRHIFPEWHLNYNSAFRKIVNSTIVKDHYAKLSKTYGYRIVPLQDEIIQLSRLLRNDPNRITDAIDLLENYIPDYPKVWQMHELLGDIYLKAGQKEKAIIAYQNALKLSPDPSAIQQKLDQL